MANQIVKIVDASASGTVVSIGGVNIVDFLDEGNPVEFSDTEVANIEWSCNGRMIRTVKPSAVMVSVTVIPGSNSDEGLFHLWRSAFCNGGRVMDADKQLTGLISMEDGWSVSLSGGTCVSGPAGCNIQGNGKFGGNTYTFAFENIN